MFFPSFILSNLSNLVICFILSNLLICFILSNLLICFMLLNCLDKILKLRENLNNWILWYILEHIYYILCMYIFIYLSSGRHLYFVRKWCFLILLPGDSALGLLGSTTKNWHFFGREHNNLVLICMNCFVPTVAFKRCSSLNKRERIKQFKPL